ncbi:MAG: aminoacetone oxidase family FAD-binding enzyme [Oscillospiraceae bacterium]
MADIAIIGGGASGIISAISLLQKANINVTVYEKMPRILKKILATGNGRCNITNLYTNSESYWDKTDFVRFAIEKYSPNSNIDFFKSMGLLCKIEDEGRVYPLSSQASSVVNTLLIEAQRLGVKVITDTEITDIKIKNNQYILNNKFKADCVLISSGGKSAKSQGTNGGSYKLLKMLGHNIINPTPALTALCGADFPKSLKGIRAICNAELIIDDKKIYTEKGEIQFTDYGISGIPIMQMSRLVSTSKSKSISVKLDTLPDISQKELEKFLLARNQIKEISAENVLIGILPKQLSNYLLLKADIKKDAEFSFVPKTKITELSILIKNWNIKISNVRDFDFSQVTAGGADLSEFNNKTMMSKLKDGLFCSGEALDVDGKCGGYNLQWAWSSGRLAADGILEYLRSKNID